MAVNAEKENARLSRDASRLRAVLGDRPTLAISDAEAHELAARSGVAAKRVVPLAAAVRIADATGLPLKFLDNLFRARARAPHLLDPKIIGHALDEAVTRGTLAPLSADARIDIAAKVESLRPRQSFADLSFGGLSLDLGAAAIDPIVAQLARIGIETPQALLQHGTVEAAAIPHLPIARVRELESHVRLGLLGISAGARTALFDQGFTSPAAIGATSIAEFRSQLAPLIGAAESERIHAAATVQQAFLENLSTAGRMQSHATNRSFISRSLAPDADADLVDCQCDDCMAATSPLAYLADLLTYTQGRLSRGDADPVTPQMLSDLLKQPYEDLPADCGSVDEQVLQVRLCIEALRRLLGTSLAALPDVVGASLEHTISFGFAADVDGDLRDELIIGFDVDPSSWLSPRAEVGLGVWVLRYDARSSAWTHLAPGPDPVGAAFYLPPDLSVNVAFAGTFRADTTNTRRDRQQLVFALRGTSLGEQPVFVLEFDPVARVWSRITPSPGGGQVPFVEPGGVFRREDRDFAIPYPTSSVTLSGGFAADVDGDQLAEFVAYGKTPDQNNAVWVFELQGNAWGAVGPMGQPYDVALVCDPAVAGVNNYEIRAATAGDVNHDGRAEIIAIPAAPGGLGKNAWIMRYDPGAGTWGHLIPGAGLPLDTDADLGPAPWPTAHVLVANVTGLGSAELVIAPDAVLGPNPSDPNSFTPYSYTVAAPPALTDYFTDLPPIDVSPNPDPVRIVLAADIDGDLRDELIVFSRRNNLDAAFVMDRTGAGAWEHLSPIAGHPMAADLDWSPPTANFAARFAFAADVDADGQKEIVVAGNTCTQIWVLKYRTGPARWEHIQSASAFTGERYESAAYQALLVQLGTSYAEMRLARTVTDTARQQLAARLAIPLGSRQPNVGDRLDQLLLDPGTVTEETLERLFGLISTSRDPLSSVAVAGDTRGQTRHWRLYGAVWSADPASTTTDDDGKIYVTLTLVNGRVNVVLFRDAARNFSVAMGEGARSGTIRLSSLNGSNLSGRVRVEYVADTTGITLTALPALACWQQQELRERWDAEDAPLNAFAASAVNATIPVPLPIVDPDLIGPDDFRLPLPTGQATGAFDLWVARRNWIDGLLSSLGALNTDFDAMLATLRPPAGAANPNDYPWNGAPALTEFPGILARLSAGDATTVAAAAKIVQGDLYLEVDAFVRLMTLQSRNQIGIEPLADDEWAEVRAILVSARKGFRRDAWRVAEFNAGIVLDGDTFVGAPVTPVEGTWPPTRPAQTPLIEPETLSMSDLPASMAGLEAGALFRLRTAALRASLASVRARRPQGLESVLVEGFAARADGTAWVPWVAARLNELQGPNSAAAETQIRAQMPGLTLSAFRRLATTTARAAVGSALSETEWSDLEATVATGRKYRVLYPTWLAEESNAARPIPYWKARRAVLPRWLASTETRALWEQALRDATRAPVVDPDLIDPAWLVSAGSRAYELYHGRPILGAAPGRQTLLLTAATASRALITSGASTLEGLDAALIDAFAPGTEHSRIAADITARRTATSSDRVLNEALGERAAALTDLSTELAAGGNRAQAASLRILSELGFSSIAAFQQVMSAINNPGATTAAQWQAIDRTIADLSVLGWVLHLDERAVTVGVKVPVLLDQLDLTASAWRRLGSLRDLVERQATLLTDEWDDVVDILVRVYKLRRYARWRIEERGVAPQVPVRLGPDSFYIPDDTSTDRAQPPSPSRVLPTEMREWRDTLDARTQQNADVLHALQSSLLSVEQATLPALRDRLIASLPAAQAGLDAARKWVEDFLLIDAHIGGCQQTTRAAFAIDALLALLWSVRSGQLADTYPLLRLEAQSFDAEWPWIGSYSPWRSAMLVYLYPENVLHPSLRANQTPAFRDMVQALRSGRRLAPAGARRVAVNYADYFRDVCTLDVHAMACVTAWSAFDPQLMIGTSRTQALCEHRFAISGASGRLYWSLALIDRSLEPTPGFWQYLDHITGRSMALVGATVYSTPDERWVYVFVLTDEGEGRALRASRYSLSRGAWETDVIPLELPSGATEVTGWVIPASPPRIALGYTTVVHGVAQETEIYRSLNVKGTAWERNDFAPLVREYWQPLGHPLGAGTANVLNVLAGDFDGDGQDEIALVRGVAPTTAVWKLDPASQDWGQLTNPTAAQAIDGSRDVVAGRFIRDNAADSRDQLVGLLPDAFIDSGVEKVLVAQRFNPAANTWEVQGAGVGGIEVKGGLKSILAGDLNGDGVAEVVTLHDTIGIPTGQGHPAPARDFLGVWTWNGTSFANSLELYTVPFGTLGEIGLGVVGDFDGDGRDELAVAAAGRGEFWVLDFAANGQLRGQLGPLTDSDVKTVLVPFEQPTGLRGAFRGDFDGDGRDELAIIPYISTPNRGTEVKIADFVPDPRDPDPGVAGGWVANFPSIDLSGESVAVLTGVAGDFDADGFDEVALFGANKVWVRKYDLASQSWISLPDTLVARIAFGQCGNFSGPKPTSYRSPRRGARGRRMQDQLALLQGTLSTTTGLGTADTNGVVSVSRMVTRERPAPCQHPESVPLYSGDWTLDDTSDRRGRRALTQAALSDNAGRAESVQVCLWEAFYGLPLSIALVLQDGRDYLTALDWFRLVYDYAQPVPNRRLYAGLDDPGLFGTGYNRDVLSWVQDPLDPHAIAATRPLTYARGTLLFVIRCVLDFADAEFTVDTAEAIGRAWILYRTALELLQLPEIEQRLGDCTDVIARVPVSSIDPVVARTVRRLEQDLPLLGNRATIRKVAGDLASALERAQAANGERIAAAETAMARAVSKATAPRTVGTVLAESATRSADQPLARRIAPDFAMTLASIADTGDGPRDGAPIFLARNVSSFCVGPNPLLQAFRLKAELNLAKIENCRNIAGVRRALETYSGPTDQQSGLPMLSTGGQLALPGAAPLAPTPYRYSALIQRAKELVAHAEQLESLMLGALEKRDNEALTLLKTRQDIQVVRATVRTQDLRLKEAEDSVALGMLQQQRAEIEADHYQQLLDAGETALEQEMFRYLQDSISLQLGAAAFNTAAATSSASAAFFDPSAAISAMTSAASAASNLASAAGTQAQIRQLQAGLERTREEWQLRTQVAAQDQRIARQNTQIETDHVSIAEQERTVTELQADNAEQLLDFHRNKFTSFELYDWMSDILGRSYNFFLQQATSVAQLAARQLAFERQDGEPPAIQPDYWTPPTEGLARSGATETAPTDRRGLTGSARLLQDIYQLDQWALDTTKRKLHLSKTFSLARLTPIDFETLRTTGVMSFATPGELFDADFPGHYLRLIKRVSVSVVALIPSPQGIHATLSSTGVSRVVVGPDVFQTVIVHRLPESIALTSPLNATGVFTFDVQPELANPFESFGVDTTWELRMPRAGNQLDYRSLADVLVTLDYTALDSADYRQQVIRRLDQRFLGDRAYSLRNEFPDAWWDLHNPEQIARAFSISFETSGNDFPPSLDDLRISQVALLFVTQSDVAPEAMPAELKFIERGATTALGGSVVPVEHVVSTRRANGGPLRPVTGKTPVGRWTLALTDSDETREWMASEELLDIVLVVSYEAETPAWPT